MNVYNLFDLSDSFTFFAKSGNSFVINLPNGIKIRCLKTTEIPEKTGFMNLKKNFLSHINCVRSITASSNFIIFILNFASMAFALADGLLDMSFIKNARASLFAILLKLLNPTSFRIDTNISEIIKITTFSS